MSFNRLTIRNATTAGFAAVLSLTLAACGMIRGEEELRAPNYASPSGNENWEVNCGRQTVVVDDDSLEQFYNEDGTVKTYREFCREAEPSIKRDRRR